MTTTLPAATPAARSTGPRRRREPVLRSGHLLVVNSALTAISGLAYWLVAARFYDADDVGRNLAAISALTLLGGVAQVNIMTALLRFVPWAGRASGRLVARGYLLATVLTALAGSVFLAGLGVWSDDLRFLRADALLAGWFVVSVAIWALFSIQDHVLTAVRRTRVVPLENLAFALLKLVLVVVLAAALPATGILLSWTIAAAVAVAATSGYLFSRALPAHMLERPVADPPATREMARFLTLDYVGSLASFAAVSGLPLVVIAHEGPVATAGFLLAWTIVYSLYLVPLAMGQSLIAHAADPDADLARDVRTLTGHALALVVPAVVLLVVFAPQVLALFGPDYVEHASTLRLLALSAVPNVLVDLTVSSAQVRQRMRVVVATRLGQCGLVIGLSLFLMPRHGIVGVASAWLAAQCVMAVAVALGSVARHSRGARGGQDAPPDPPCPAVPTAPLSVTAVVCCYTERRWEQLLEAVDSLRSQSYPLREIVVVVDHNPALLSRVQRVLPWVIAVPSDGPPGLSGARNTGVALAHGEVVAFLDDDALARPGWVSEQVAAYADSRVVGTAATIHPLWESGRPGWFPSEFDWVVGCSWTGLPTGSAPVRNAIGAGMTLRRAPMVAVGGFATELGRVGTVPVGCEETDLCIRLRAADPAARIVTVPAALTLHRVPADRGTFRYFRSRCWAEGVSKAKVRARSAGSDALDTERGYVTRVLPRAIGRALVQRRPRRGLCVLAGLAATVGGYLTARLLAHRTVRVLVAIGPLTAALTLWLLGLRNVDLDGMDDFGLVSVLPPSWFVALGAGVVLLGLHIARRSSGPLIAAHLVAMVTILHATPAVLYAEPRYSWTFKHIGVVDYISRHGSLDPSDATLGVYHSWPGFFTASSFLSDAAGIDPATMARWAPPVFQLAFLIPALVAFRCLSDDPRRVWLALALFASGNWVGQDYFAPQALTYLLLLTAVALVLRWLPDAGLERNVLERIRTVHDPAPVRRAHPAHRIGTAGLLIALTAAIAGSHQLTPLVLAGTLCVLALHRRSAPRWAPVVAGAFAVFWTATLGLHYLRTHSTGLWATLGRPDSNAAQSLASATVPDQQVVIWVGRALVAAMIALACYGYLRERRGGGPRTAALLAMVPVPLLATNYDGEIVLRVYLFALPWLALLAAGAVYRRGRSGGRGLGTVALLLAFITAFLPAYYGKERANHFNAAERAANTWLLQHAERGSVLMGAALDFPWKDDEYERFRYRWLSELPLDQRLALPADPAAIVTDVMGESEAFVGYLLLSRSQEAALAYGDALPATIQDTVGRALMVSPAFDLVYANGTAMVFRHEFVVEEGTP